MEATQMSVARWDDKHEKVKSLSHVWLIVTPWTVAYQAPTSMEFSRQEYWSGFPFPSPEDWTQGLPLCRQMLYLLSHIQSNTIIGQSLNHVQLFAAPGFAACQASLSFTVSWGLLKLMFIESVMPSNNLILCLPLLLLPSIFPIIPKNWLFASGGQSIGASASASVLPMTIQCWFPLGLTGLISSLSKGLLRLFSSNIIWKHQFFDVQHSFWSNSHICTWLL